jgi:outer membrane lipoprotein carrier protein
MRQTLEERMRARNSLLFNVGIAIASAGLLLGEANPPLNADPLIHKIESHYNRARTLSLRYREMLVEEGHSRRPESGVLTLRKPGKMRWEYDTPAGKLFVCDGKQVYLYTPRDQRVERSSLKMSADLRAPMAFLLGHLDLKREFGTFSTRAAGADTWLDATAKNDRLPYEKIELLVAPDASIRELNVIGRDQSTLSFSFSGETLNPPVSDKLFQFAVPPGAEVVDAVTTDQEN